MLKIENIDALFIDFDGVLTDNRVWVDQSGREMVCCNRRDGLAFDVLRKDKIKRNVYLFICLLEKILFDDYYQVG